MESTVMVSSLLCNIFIGCCCLLILAWAAVAINMLLCERRDDKRKEAAEIRDKEYHEKRMEAYK